MQPDRNHAVEHLIRCRIERELKSNRRNAVLPWHENLYLNTLYFECTYIQI
jgi:hypothetical protein